MKIEDHVKKMSKKWPPLQMLASTYCFKGITSYIHSTFHHIEAIFDTQVWM